MEHTLKDWFSTTSEGDHHTCYHMPVEINRSWRRYFITASYKSQQVSGLPLLCRWNRMMANFWRLDRESQFDTYPTPRVDDSTMQNPSPHNLYRYLYIVHQPSHSQFLEAWLSRWMHTVHCWTLPVKSHLGQHQYPPTSDLTWATGRYQLQRECATKVHMCCLWPLPVYSHTTRAAWGPSHLSVHGGQPIYFKVF